MKLTNYVRGQSAESLKSFGNLKKIEAQGATNKSLANQTINQNRHPHSVDKNAAKPNLLLSPGESSKTGQNPSISS